VNDLHVRAYRRALRARNLSDRTVETYLAAVAALRRHLGDADLAAASTDDLLGFVQAQLSLSAATASIRYRALRQFFKWAEAEGVRGDDPMLRVPPPVVPETPVAVLTLEQVKGLLAVCGGRSFTDRRDNAMVRLFLEPGGPRVSELVGLAVGDLDLDRDVALVHGKGRRERGIPFGARTGQALDRYVRLRAQHAMRDVPALWLGGKGPMTRSGVQQMLRRRAAQSGLAHLHPHMLRHTSAHEWLDSGGSETDAMRLFGWRSRQMLQRYGASVAAQRAQDAARRAALGDRY